MDDSQAALQALIDDIEALGWDFPEQLDVLEDAPPDQEAFALIYWQALAPQAPPFSASSFNSSFCMEF
jgi:hypothetical protein